MTLRNENLFRQSLPANFNGLFDWDYLNTCFPREIEFTDIDAVVEIGGCLLFVETKDVGVPIPLGQQRMYRELLKLPNTRLLIVWGKNKDSVRRLEIHYGLGSPKVIDPANFRDVISAVNAWVDHANWFWEEKRLNKLLVSPNGPK